MIVTGWVLCVIPLLVFTLGYMLLHLPAMDRALWRSSSLQAHLMATAAAGRQYAAASADFISIFLEALPVAGSVYIVAGLARRAAMLGGRWSAGYPRRRLLVSVAALAWLTLLVLFWTTDSQFRGW
jgi:putative peptide zinc metalloprotease protein